MAVWNASRPLDDEDLQLALYCSYELTYRGFAGVEDELEWDASTLELRRRLERWFETALRAEVRLPEGDDPAAAVDALLQRPNPSLAAFLERATAQQFRELLVLRSAYQSKEADPHSWALPRHAGRAKRALAEIQAGEYGVGHRHTHAELFGECLAAAGLDPVYGAHLDRIPGLWLAGVNLISLFGLHRRLRGALLGHLALFEMDSVEPSARLLAAARRLGFDEVVQRVFAVHVVADVEHATLAESGLLRAYAEDEPGQRDNVVFGAAALWHLERLATSQALEGWRCGDSALRPASQRRTA
ncbi:MAG: iron-containing redox enzyme family protein [Acidimicrobiales bacterium]